VTLDVLDGLIGLRLEELNGLRGGDVEQRLERVAVHLELVAADGRRRVAADRRGRSPR
jgi:hypothetical protein